jgi:prevent-host-death family protein
MRTVLDQIQPPEVTSLRKPSDPGPTPPVERIAISKARSMIGQLVTRVHVDKERIVLEKSGIPVAALVSIDEFKQFLAFQEASASR